MKKLILTFFLIVLIVLLVKRNEHFVQGCKIANLKKNLQKMIFINAF